MRLSIRIYCFIHYFCSQRKEPKIYIYPQNIPKEVRYYSPGLQKRFIATYNKFSGSLKEKKDVITKAWEEVEKYYFYDNRAKSYLPRKTKVALKNRYEVANDCPLDVQELPNEMYKRIWMVQYNNHAVSGDYEYAKNMAWQAIKRFVFYDSNTCEWKSLKKRAYINGYEEAIIKKIKTGGDSMLNVDCNQPFKFFVPLMKSEGASFLFEKKDDKGGINYFLKGEASNTKIDKAGERVSSNFIKKMINTALGLNAYIEHEHHTLKTVGYISNVEGDNDTFIPTVHLEPIEENPYSKSIVMKTRHGTKLGFSISGTLSKVSTTYDEKSGINVTELVDGNIDEVSVTARPCGDLAPFNLVQSIQKSLNELDKSGKIKKDAVPVVKKESKEIDVVALMKKLNELEQDSALNIFGSVLVEIMYSFRKLVWNTYYDMTLSNDEKTKRMNSLRKEFIEMISGQMDKIIEAITPE